MSQSKVCRVEFTHKHDLYLVKFLAVHNPTKEGRSGVRIYKTLVANEHALWPWSVHHPAQSWRERYVRNADAFDARIKCYQEKHGIVVKGGKKRLAEAPIAPLPKRAKLDVAPPSDISPNARLEPPKPIPGPSRSEPAAPIVALPNKKSIPEAPPKPTYNQAIEIPPSSPHERPSTSIPSTLNEPAQLAPSPAPVNTPPVASSTPRPAPSQKSPLEFPPLTTRNDTLELPPSPPEKPEPVPAPAPAPDIRTVRTPLRPVKKRQRSKESDVFASMPPSPRRVSAPSVPGPSSQSQAGPSAFASSAQAVPAVYPRAPPRLVQSFRGPVMVDQRGRVPRVAPRGGAEEDEEDGEKEQWPPARGRLAGVKGKGPKINGHHPFSQSQHRQDVVAKDARESRHPFSRVERPTGDINALNRRAVAALFGKGARKQKTDETMNDKGKEGEKGKADEGVKPAEVQLRPPPPPPPPPVPEPQVLPIPKPLSKLIKFPAPRASTHSPFRPELPRQEPAAQAVRNPALTRVRRQTIGYAHENVPSVDLVTMSSSTSTGTSSNSSAKASASERPPRWSLPANATPWNIERERTGTESPFRWAAPSPLFAGLRTHVLSPSLASASSFLPPPLLTSPGAPHVEPQPHSHSGSGLSTSPLDLTPHLSDVSLAASHGLASILAHMSANHGLALPVVQAVYHRVGSLREADEVLRGMREAAEGFGRAEIERRTRGSGGSGSGGGRGRGLERGRESSSGSGSESGNGSVERGRSRRRRTEGTQLRYVVASEDGEGSQYDPPETSRAAVWKRQSLGNGGVYEDGEEAESEDAEDQAVDEELRVETDGEEDEGEHADADVDAEDQAIDEELHEEEDGEKDGGESWLPNIRHDFSHCIPSQEEPDNMRKNMSGTHDRYVERDAWEEDRVETLLVNEKAQKLEQKVGRSNFHKHVKRMFK